MAKITMRRMHIVRAFLLFIISAPAFAIGAPFSGSSSQAAELPRLLVILDSSITMEDKLAGELKYKLVRKAMKKSLPSFEAKIAAGLITFGRKESNSCEDIQRNLPIKPLKSSPFLIALEHIKPKGKSPIGAALAQAAQMARIDQSPANMLLIADGADNCRADICATAALLANHSPKTQIHVIGLGNGASVKRLACIAEATNGQFAMIRNREGMTSALDRIFKTVSSASPETISGLDQDAGNENASVPEPLPPLPTRKPETVVAKAEPATPAPGAKTIEPEAEAPVAQAPAQEQTKPQPKQAPAQQARPAFNEEDDKQKASVTKDANKEAKALQAEENQKIASIQPKKPEAEKPEPAAPDTSKPEPIETLPLAPQAMLVAPEPETMQATPKVQEKETTPAAAATPPAPAAAPPASQAQAQKTDPATPAKQEASIPTTTFFGDKPNIEVTLPDSTAPVKLRALITEEGGEIENGLIWRIYKTERNKRGDYKLIKTVKTAHLDTDLPLGAYLVNLSWGRSNLTEKMDILSSKPFSQNFVLNAGGLRLGATDSSGNALPERNVIYRIFSDERDQFGKRQLIFDNAKSGKIIRLNAGIYHVTSHYGTANGLVASDITVEAGKLTEAIINHTASKVTFKLVNAPGGEALAGAVWRILTPEGKLIKETGGALPTHILAAGDYTIQAQYSGRTYARKVSIEPGDPIDIEIVIQ